jgi:uncharacterized protein (DUF1501 family)
MLLRSRREFLKSSVKSVTALAATGALAKFGEMTALASPTSGYQALVCIFMTGGNDGHNTVIPLSTAQQNYSFYQKARQGLALPQKSLLSVANGNDAYGLHPSLTELQSLYHDGKAAILANVGNLVQPLNRAHYQSGNSNINPIQLFSHSDQTTQWQSGDPSGLSPTGWGGRIGDLMQSHNTGALFPSLSATSACGLFCTGRDTFPAIVPPAGSLKSPGTGMAGLEAIDRNPVLQDGVQQLLTFDDGLQLVQASNNIVVRGQNYVNTLQGLVSKIRIATEFPADNALAAQLQTVAKVIAVRNELKLTKQIFFCQFGGFDTHNSQLETQTALLSQLSKAVAAFYKATQELGVEQNVTTFTASEFGRTLTPADANGSDHAWGSHHFIIGGGVQGGKMYGEFPHLALGGDYDATGRGVLIPTTAVTQYGATMAKWFGVGNEDLPKVFANIGNFPTPTLNFLG